MTQHIESNLKIPQQAGVSSGDAVGSWSNRKSDRRIDQVWVWFGSQFFEPRQDASEFYGRPAIVHIDSPEIHAHVMRNIEREYLRDRFLKRVTIQIFIALTVANVVGMVASTGLVKATEKAVHWQIERSQASRQEKIDSAQSANHQKIMAAQKQLDAAKTELVEVSK